jgi:CheY-like chemotaxis protein
MSVDGGTTGSVLVVEDNQDLRDAVCEVLADDGYSVVAAANGRQALEALAKGEPPCLMLLDLMMPVMDGWQVLEALATKEATAAPFPIIVLSAARDGDTAHPLVRRRLAKPVRMEMLLELVHEYCGPPAST